MKNITFVILAALCVLFAISFLNIESARAGEPPPPVKVWRIPTPPPSDKLTGGAPFNYLAEPQEAEPIAPTFQAVQAKAPVFVVFPYRRYQKAIPK